LENLEDRTLPSGSPLAALNGYHPLGFTGTSGSATPGGFAPAGIKQAYGINLLPGSNDGTGQTIAIIGAYDDPNLVSSSSGSFSTSDLHQFDVQYGLAEPAGFFTKYAQTGSGSTSFTTSAVVPQDPGGKGTQNWEGEEALSVEWAHALAPGARILLVEAADAATNLYMAANWAAQPASLGGGGAQVVSMGWGTSEFGGGEKTYDSSYFVQPSFYGSSFTYGVTYLAASGDGGAPGTYPAYSPNVIAVGATSLAVDGSGNYSVESGWSDGFGESGGGVSSYEAPPAFQAGLGFSQRSIPDVSFEGAGSTPVSVYDSFNGNTPTPWYQYYGTSVATPCWAALIGIADQLRANQGLASLSGPAQVLPMLYTLSSTDFHDITTGNNGFAAGAGYDLVTGLGTPLANKLVPDLAALHVDASTPGNGVVVASPPTTFNVTFTDPINPSSLHANALTINGIAATGVTLDSTKTIATFTFASNPVVSQGPQTMNIAAGAVAAQSSGTRTNVAFSATFYYDNLPLTITSTTPVAGGSFTLPASSLTYSVNFNQPIDPTLVKTTNLIVTPPSGVATVTSASVLPGNQTAVYTIAQTGGFSFGILTINIAGGTYKDQYDDPVSPPTYASNYYLEMNIQALPTPLASTVPLGSQIYGTSASNQLLYAGDSDRFTVAADPGQTLTVLVTPNSSGGSTPLQMPTVQLSDPSNTVLGSASSSGTSQIALLQTIPTTSSGTYTITVGGVGSASGNYTVQVYVDAALETANLGLGADTSVAAAQNLNGAFVNLQTSLTSASRATVLGGVAQPLTITANAFGDWDSTGYHLAGTPSFLVGQVPPKQYNNFFVFNLAGINPTILSASLNLSVGPAGYSSSSSSDTFGLFDVSTPIVSLEATGFGQPGIFTDLGTGVSYGSKTVTSSVNNTLLSTPFSVAGIAALNSKRGSQFALGGSLTTVVGPNAQYLFSGSGNASDTIQLSLGLADTRFYSFSLAAHELATVGLKNLTGVGGETITIQDGSGNVLASGAGGAANLDQIISNFVAPIAGTYYVVVSGSNNSTYSLVVTRDATFDQKANSSQSTAQDLSSTGGVLGYVAASPAVDWYRVTLSGGQNALQVETKIPLTGPSQAIDTLAPSIGLYNAGGTLLVSGTVLPDGRNQSLLASGLSSGTTYYVKLTAATGAGEYYLGVTQIQTPAVSSSPSSQSVVAGQPVTFAAAASGQPAPTVQWQVSTNGGSSYTPISGATSTSYTISNTSTSQSGNLYKAVFTNPGGSVATAPATLTVTPAPVFAKYLVTALISSSTVTAGNSFALQVIAGDQFGNPLTSGYTGPSSVTVSLVPPSTASGFPFMLNLNSNGAGWAVVSLVQVGTYTINVSGGGFSGSTSPITVMFAAAAKLAFGVQPASVATGNTLSAFTVQVLDAYGNLITSDNTDHVSLGIANGPGPFKSGSTTTVTVSGGTATFNNVTLITPGSYQFTETVQGLFTGPNSNPFPVIPLQVVPGSFASSPSGFSLQFNAPFLVNAVTPVLYGVGFGANAPVPSVTLTQTKDGSGNPANNPVEGSLVLNTANNSMTFVATNTAYQTNTGSPVLPDGTYTVNVTSTAAANGFQALNSGGGFLDGKGTGTAGSGDYTTTFTVTAAAANDDVVWVPATADGPGQLLNAPGNNQVGGGYPIYLNDSTGSVTNVTVTLHYNPALLTVTGVTGAHFALLGTSTAGQAVLQYNGPTLPMGPQTPIGFLTASVPAGTTANPMPYRAKDLLTLTGLSVTGTHGVVPAVADNALHLITYVGDADGNGSYSSNDAVLITRVGLQTDAGFAAYSLVDPVVVADTDGSGFIPADAALQANEAGVGFPTSTLSNPAVPPGVHFTIITNNVDSTTLPTFTSGTPTTMATAGQAYSFTVTANGSPAPTLSASNLPSWLSFNPATGVLSGTPTLATTYTNLQITATNTAGSATTTFNLTVNPGPVNRFGLTAVASTQAGSNFLFTVQAEDSNNNPSSNFSGTVSFATTDPQGSVPAPTMVTGGFGFFLATLKTMAGGPWTITATSGAISGQSPPITVTPGPASKVGFGVQPVNTPAGLLLPTVTVQILDPYGNVVTSDNADVVTVGVSSGPGTFLAGSTLTATAASGVASFANLTLVTPGSYHLSAVVANTLTGPNSAAFTVIPLQVQAGSFASNASGFSLQFNAPFLVNSLTPVLYGSGYGPTAPAPSVTVTQTKNAGGNPVNNPVEGSLVLNTANNSITFVATDTAYQVNNGSPILPDGTYTVVIHSSAATDGFQALNNGGGFLDGLGTGTPGSGDFTKTFVVNAAAMGLDAVWVPDVAEGPGQALNAPGNNQVGGGYPIYLNDSTGSVTSVLVTLNYSPALLTVSGVTGANFTLLSNTPGQAVLQYSGPALPSGSQLPLGFLTASVPNGTVGSPVPYKAKDLLTLTGLSVMGTHGVVPAVVANALHLVAYEGDGDGNGQYSSNDAVLITRVALQADAGFPAYALVDPVILADTDGSGFIPADAALQVNEAGVGFPTTTLAKPPIPPNVHFTPIGNNVDPTLSLPSDLQVGAGGVLTVPVTIDDPYPEGSTGLIEAHLALTYDPRQFTVSVSDIHAGSVLIGGKGWSVLPTINPLTGEIAIALSSDTPIHGTLGGSLVAIDFHQVGRMATPSVIALVSSVNPTGSNVITTELEDAQGTFTLTLGPTQSFVTSTETPAANVTRTVVASLSSVVRDHPIDSEAAKVTALATNVPETAAPTPTEADTAVHIVAGSQGLTSAATNLLAAMNPALADLAFQVAGTSLAGIQNGMSWLSGPVFLSLARIATNPTDPAFLVTVRDALDRGLSSALLRASPSTENLDFAGLDDLSDLAGIVGEDLAQRQTPAHRVAADAAPPMSLLDRVAVDQYFAGTADASYPDYSDE
jgi:hypothetical protein